MNPPTHLSEEELSRISSEQLPHDFFLTPDKLQIRIRHGEYDWSIASNRGWHLHDEHFQEMPDLLNLLFRWIQWWRRVHNQHYIVIGELDDSQYMPFLKGIYSSVQDAKKGTEAFGFTRRTYIPIDLPEPQ